MNNPIQLVRAFRNPQEFLNQARQNPNVQNNPMLNNVLDLAEKGDSKGVEQIARNLVEGQGKNFDEEFAKFKSQFGIK